MFVDTLKYPFYEKIVGSSSLIFYNLVVIGERVEMGINLRKIIDILPKVINVENPMLEETEKEELDNAVMSTTREPET